MLLETPHETDPDLPVSVWASPAQALVVACCGAGGMSVVVLAWEFLKEVTIIFITFNIVWPQVNNR